MKVKGKHSESFPMYIAFLCAGAVAAVIGFFIIFNALGGNAPKVEEKPSVTEEAPAATTPADDKESGYVPAEEESEAMKDAATELILNNYEVLKLYYIKGMNHLPEPYDNIPEDGYYSVDSQKYTQISELNELVDSTYIGSVANEVKTNSLGNGAVYAERDNGDLGIMSDFAPMEYDVSWENPNFKLYPQSDSECLITVTASSKTTSEEVTLDGVMIKTDDGWRLGAVIL